MLWSKRIKIVWLFDLIRVVCICLCACPAYLGIRCLQVIGCCYEVCLLEIGLKERTENVEEWKHVRLHISRSIWSILWGVGGGGRQPIIIWKFCFQLYTGCSLICRPLASKFELCRLLTWFEVTQKVCGKNICFSSRVFDNKRSEVLPEHRMNRTAFSAWIIYKSINCGCARFSTNSNKRTDKNTFTTTSACRTGQMLWFNSGCDSRSFDAFSFSGCLNS